MNSYILFDFHKISILEKIEKIGILKNFVDEGLHRLGPYTLGKYINYDLWYKWNEDGDKNSVYDYWFNLKSEDFEDLLWGVIKYKRGKIKKYKRG